MSQSIISDLRGRLTTPKIVLPVVAAAAPLAAVVGTVPLSFALGNGVGVPGVFLFAGAVLLVDNFPILTGTTNPIVNAIPWLLVAAVVFGTAFALWLRGAHPDRYAGIAADQAPVPAGQRAIETAGVR